MPAAQKHRKKWREFEEAREYVRGLGLRSQKEWTEYTGSGQKPSDIPADPRKVYKEAGWHSMGDWLGTGYVANQERQYRPFEEAREFARSLGLKNSDEWRAWGRRGERPLDIPSNPNTTYRAHWSGWGDWLRSEDAPSRWRSFEEAREYARSLGLKGSPQWREYCMSGQRPHDIPAAPHNTYKDEWQGYPDWLGTGWRPFEEAREYVHSLGFKGKAQWAAFCRSRQRPDDIPVAPDRVYRTDWISWGDWLGTDSVATFNRQYRPFEEAREFVRSLGLSDQREWREYYRSGQKSSDIPTTPERVYKDDGWTGYGDWLGTGRTRGAGWRPFEEARTFVRSLGLKNKEAWEEYCQSGKKPDDIPAAPWAVYGNARKGDKAMAENMLEGQDQWRGWADWLGVVSKWNRNTLLAFLEDLRPHLKVLKETELYLILQQGGQMPRLRKALGKTTALGVLKDLQENDGNAIEEALKNAADEEIADSDVEDDLPKEEPEDKPLEDHTPEDEELREDLVEASGLAALASPEALRLVDDLAEMHYGLDDETAQYLVDNRVAGLWEAYTATGDAALDALRGEGGHYFQLIRERFSAELEGAKNLPIPAGWAFRPPGSEHEAPAPPNLMQRRTAHVLATRKRHGNWSGVGSGKTLAGILASRVTDRKHTLVICNKATVPGWCREIRNAFPDSVVRTSVGPWLAGDHLYTVLNYEKFQQRNRRELVEELITQQVDFVVLDEVQFVKQRDKNVSGRRQAIHALLSELDEQNPDVHVLGMSATPVINTLTEARRLVEIITGRTFADLDTQATVNNALAMHRTLMIHGLRYRPRYEIETTTDTPTVVRNDLVDDLRAGEGVLHLEQTLLPPKLELTRPNIRPGTLIYTHYVDGMVGPIRSFVERIGYRTGLYTGDDKSGLEDFLTGRVDVLIGSKPVGTGLDGLQKRCDQILMLSLPWTSAEYEQIVGRVRRQGSAFGSVRVVVPQVNLDYQGDVWSWDERRMDTIRFKRTLSDCALDGNIPEVARISPKELEERGRKALEAWIERVRGGDAAVGVERPRLRIPLPPALKERLQVKVGDFTTLNNRWSTANSGTVHSRLQDDPAEWYLYHTLYREAREAREGWSEVPAVRIAEDLQARTDLRVGDFGAGECLLRDALPDHDVVSLDHVALDDGVIACDMASTPLQDGELGAVVFSLSLMGRNWRDYLAEAHRVLQPFGLLFIAEPTRKWEDTTRLEEAVHDAGFELLPTTRRGNFVYLRGIKYS